MLPPPLQQAFRNYQTKVASSAQRQNTWRDRECSYLNVGEACREGWSFARHNGRAIDYPCEVDRHNKTVITFHFLAHCSREVYPVWIFRPPSFFSAFQYYSGSFWVSFPISSAVPRVHKTAFRSSIEAEQNSKLRKWL